MIKIEITKQREESDKMENKKNSRKNKKHPRVIK